MDDYYGSDTKWLWVLGIVVLIVAVVGLVFAISAKNSSVDESKVTDQINEELTAAGVAVEGEETASENAEKVAAADRRRLRQAVRAEKQSTEKRIDQLAAETKQLNGKNAELKSVVTRLEVEYSELFENQEELEREVEKLGKQVKRLS
jgi:TolA-binding protein